jgi:hypothetical protein
VRGATQTHTVAWAHSSDDAGLIMRRIRSWAPPHALTRSPTEFVVCRGCHSWPQAARVAAARPTAGMSSCTLGPFPDRRSTYGDLLECLNVWLELSMRNGTFRTIPFFAQGMLENIGVTQAVNDLLLTSHGFGLKLFPIWAALRPAEPASFVTLRAKGAFLVTADTSLPTRAR